MPESTRYYALAAFLAGASLATIWSARQHSSGPGKEACQPLTRKRRNHLLRLAESKDIDLLVKALRELDESSYLAVSDIKEGIEGCIGNTPLIKIKSLSDATGCEILAKAEVFILGLQ